MGQPSVSSKETMAVKPFWVRLLDPSQWSALDERLGYKARRVNQNLAAKSAISSAEKMLLMAAEIERGLLILGLIGEAVAAFFGSRYNLVSGLLVVAALQYWFIGHRTDVLMVSRHFPLLPGPECTLANQAKNETPRAKPVVSGETVSPSILFELAHPQVKLVVFASSKID